MSDFDPNFGDNQSGYPVYEKVNPYTENDTIPESTIEIRGFNPNTHKESIKLYFKNLRRLEGGDISEYTWNSDVIYITYENEEIAKRVCDRRHVVDNATLNVRQCRKPQGFEEQRTEKGTLQTLIEQQGQNSTLDSQTAYRREPTATIIEEKRTSNNVICEDVKGLKPFNLPPYSSVKEELLQLPTSVFEDKVLVENLNPKTTQECLLNFLGAKTGATPSEFVYNREGTSTVVSFKENFAFFEKLQTACNNIQLEKNYLKVSRVPVTNSVVITGTDETTTEDSVRYYFENKSSSCGGEVSYIKYNKDEEGWLVYFKETKAMEDVCQRAHQVEEKKITVRLFYPCLGTPQFQSKSDIKQAKLAEMAEKDAILKQKSSDQDNTHEKKTDTSDTEINLPETKENKIYCAQVAIPYEANAINIKETHNRISHAGNILNRNLMCVKKTQTYKRAVLIKYLMSQRERLESVKQCIIELNKEISLQRETSAKLEIGDSLVTMSYVLPSGQTISVRDGAIFDLDVDVIVCTANKDLKLVSGLGKAIAVEGGPSIQNECDRYIKLRGPLRERQVYVSSGGTLRCKHVVFVKGPMYTEKRNLEEILKELIWKSLEECEKLKMNSVVFPAICTGYNQFPVDDATRIITTTIQDFFRSNVRSCVKKVYLCDTYRNKIESFERAMESVFGAEKCKQRANQKQKLKRNSSCGIDTTLQSRRTYFPGSGDCENDEESDKIGDFVNLTVGKLDLRIIQGDITCSKTDVLVISARPDMDMSKGLLSKDVRKKGGDIIQQELNSQRAKMKSEGMVVTSSGNLPCKYIIHIDITEIELSSHWKTKFKNLFKKTDELEIQSVAIPTLRIRKKEDIGIIAKGLYQALHEYRKSRFLQEVHVVIYEAETKNRFLEEIRKLQGSPAMSSILRRLSSRLLVPFSDQYRTPVSEEKLTITVYSESDKTSTQILRMIDEDIQENIPRKKYTNSIIKELSPQQQQSILSIPEYICVEVTLNMNSGEIKLVGSADDLKKAQQDVERIIQQAERNKKDLAKFVKSIKLNIS